VRLQSPQYKIGGTTDRQEPGTRDQRDQPGPGHYDLKQLLGGSGSLKYLIGKRLDEHPGNRNPGPGYYNPSDLLVKEHAPVTSFSKVDRSMTSISPDRLASPGPGVYDPVNKRYPKIEYAFS
jgi:Sperm-tail PG-rich repeat